MRGAGPPDHPSIGKRDQRLGCHAGVEPKLAVIAERFEDRSDHPADAELYRVAIANDARDVACELHERRIRRFFAISHHRGEDGSGRTLTKHARR